MPRYDFRCRQCGETFEVYRPMSSSGEPATCPDGHADTVDCSRTVAVGGRAGAPAGGGGGGAAGADAAGVAEPGDHRMNTHYRVVAQ